METKICKVISCGTPEPYQSLNGNTGTKMQIVLQELGSYARQDQSQRLPNTLVATVFGNLAQCVFYPNDVVVVAARFDAHQDKEGRWYQDVTVNEVAPLCPPKGGR